MKDDGRLCTNDKCPLGDTCKRRDMQKASKGQLGAKFLYDVDGDEVTCLHYLRKGGTGTWKK